MKQTLVGAAVAAVAMFLWGFLFWGATDIPYKAVMRAVPDEPAFAQKLTEALPETGVYLVPSPSSGLSQDEMTKRMGAGPVAQVIFIREGVGVGAGVFVWGYVHMFVTAVLAGLFLRAARPAAVSYGSRFNLVLLAGLAGSVFSNLGKPIWWHHPWSYHILYFAYDVTSWLLAALVLAKFIRERD
jgi:hypothetical protein